MRKLESLLDLQLKLDTVIGSSYFELKEIKLTDQSQWYIQDGTLSHKSGGFFHLLGVKDERTSVESLMLFQPQSALNGLLICMQGDTPYVMVQARIEPGNTGIGQYGPTVQSTPANIP